MRWRLLVVLSAILLGGACGGRSIRHGDGGGAGEEEGTVTGGVGPGTGGAGVTGPITGGAGGTGGGNPRGGTGGGMGGSTPIDSSGGTHGGSSPIDSSGGSHGGNGPDPGMIATCRLADQVFDVGASTVLPDGCTQCVCTVTGMTCDSTACVHRDPCRDVALEYSLAVGAARWCGPHHDDYWCQDALLVEETLPCGCPVLVRDLATIAPLYYEYISLGCPVPSVCELRCPLPRAPYRCSEARFCIGDL